MNLQCRSKKRLWVHLLVNAGQSPGIMDIIWKVCSSLCVMKHLSCITKDVEPLCKTHSKHSNGNHVSKNMESTSDIMSCRHTFTNIIKLKLSSRGQWPHR